MSAKKKLLGLIAQAERQVICQKINHAAHKQYFKELVNRRAIILTAVASSFIMGWIIGRERHTRALFLKSIKIVSFSALEKAIRQQW